jgi:hypothetical protein
MGLNYLRTGNCNSGNESVKGGQRLRRNHRRSQIRTAYRGANRNTPKGTDCNVNESLVRSNLILYNGQAWMTRL